MYNVKVLDKCLWSTIMVCPHAKFHIPGSSCFLVKPIKLQQKKVFRKVVQILCYTIYYCSEKQQIFGHITFSIGMENPAVVKNYTCQFRKFKRLRILLYTALNRSCGLSYIRLAFYLIRAFFTAENCEISFHLTVIGRFILIF